MSAVYKRKCDQTDYLDSKIHEAHMGPTWGRQDPGGPHVGHMEIAIWLRTPVP